MKVLSMEEVAQVHGGFIEALIASASKEGIDLIIRGAIVLIAIGGIIIGVSRLI